MIENSSWLDLTVATNVVEDSDLVAIALVTYLISVRVLRVHKCSMEIPDI